MAREGHAVLDNPQSALTRLRSASLLSFGAQPLPFGMLQDASTAFLRHLFSALLLSTQSTSPALSSSTAVVTRRDGKVIGSIFEKMLSSGSKTLIRGVRGFLESEIGPRAGAAGDEVLSWACGVACDVLEQRR